MSRGSPEDRAQRRLHRKTIEVFKNMIAMPDQWAGRKVDEAAHRQKALNDLAAMCSTDELEQIGRIVASGMPLWQVEQAAQLMNHAIKIGGTDAEH